jgi:hypothetical protein
MDGASTVDFQGNIHCLDIRMGILLHCRAVLAGLYPDSF